MNNIKMNIEGTCKIGSDLSESFAIVTSNGEIEITGTEDDILHSLENTPSHMKYAGFLILEILRLRRAASLTEDIRPLRK